MTTAERRTGAFKRTALTAIGVGLMVWFGSAVAGRLDLSRHLFESWAGQSLPKLTAHDANGTYLLSDLVDTRRRAVLIFFSAACRSCYGEISAWRSLSRVHSDKQFLGFAATVDGGFGEHIVKMMGPGFPIFVVDGGLMESLDVRALPAIMIVEAGNEIVWTEDGPGATGRLSEELRGPSS